MDWIHVDQRLPEDPKKWVIAQTQDGTLYPATYNAVKKQWSPFRGGTIDSLMHGKVVFWQDTPKGYQRIICERGHSYLKTPDAPVCPICEKFGFIKREEEPKAEPPAEPKPVEPEIDPTPVEEKNPDTPTEKKAPAKKAPAKRPARKKAE